MAAEEILTGDEQVEDSRDGAEDARNGVAPERREGEDSENRNGTSETFELSDEENEEVIGFARSRLDTYANEIVELVRSPLDTYANELTNVLLALLGTYIEVKVVTVETEQYREFIESVQPPTCFCTFLTENFQAIGMMEIELSMTLFIMERLMGGTGQSAPEIRPLTDLDWTVGKRVMEIFLETLRRSVAQTIDSNFTPNTFASDPKACMFSLPLKDEVIKALFKITIGSLEGSLKIGIPVDVLKVELSKRRLIDFSRMDGSPQYEDQIFTLLLNALLEIQAAIQMGSITIKDLLELQEGDVIHLDSSSEEEIEVIVKIQGVPKFIGKLGLMGRYRSVQLNRTVENQIDIVERET